MVAGKGGVGRSTVAAGLAVAAADAGARVLAVDVPADGGIGAALRSVSADRRRGIEVLQLSTVEALDEYLDLYLRIPIPPSRLGPLARIFDYVATAAPGVREILTIGKVAHEVRQRHVDVVVVDAPATGHMVELLAAPDNLQAVVGDGPLAEQTGWIRALLRDPATTGIVAVATPETLPVTELGELIDRIATETGVGLAAIVANRVPTLLDDAGQDEAVELCRRLSADDPLSLAVDLVASRSSAAVDELDRLAQIDPTVPFTWVEDADDPVEAVVTALAELG